MFSNPLRTDSTVDEGTIVQVDPNRSFCKVKTLNGQTLHSVQWLLPSGGSTRGADRFTPLVGDRVMINSGLGYPVIIGFLPRLQTEDGATPLSINNGEQFIDMGSYSPEGSTAWGDQNKPKDFIHGDRLLSSIGGAFLGLLRGGSVILRSTRGSELFLSNFHSLVRIVSRNWEHFTDVSSDVVKNFKGRVYRYVGYASTFAQSKIEDYRLHFYYGDAKAAETVKTNYQTYTGTPDTDNVILKEQVTDIVAGAPRELMRRTLHLNGDQEFWITNGTHFTRVKSTAEQLTLTWNDQDTITIDGVSIHAVHKDGADLIMDAAGIRATFKQGNINMSDSSILSTYDGGTVLMDSSGILTTKGAGNSFTGPSETRITNGGHTVRVTAGGVAIT